VNVVEHSFRLRSGFLIVHDIPHPRNRERAPYGDLPSQ